MQKEYSRGEKGVSLSDSSANTKGLSDEVVHSDSTQGVTVKYFDLNR